MTTERYFYHSFPRRGAGSQEEIDKGYKVLSSIKDIGLVLLPEQIEWKQSTVNGTDRIFPLLQKRVCFTELAPSEISEHAKRFGCFALEFELETVRALGAIPVFYIPQPRNAGTGDALGVSLFGVTSDAAVVIGRLAQLHKILNSGAPVSEKIQFNASFVRSPDNQRSYQIDSAEAKNFLDAVGHAVTPWVSLGAGISALLNFFYPADNTKHDQMMDYYRQREWRIACEFAVNGVPILHSVDRSEKERLTAIDGEFFSRILKTDTGDVNMLDAALVHPGIDGNRIIEMARRVIVPQNVVTKVIDLLSDLKKPPVVVALETLRS